MSWFYHNKKSLIHRITVQNVTLKKSDIKTCERKNPHQSHDMKKVIFSVNDNMKSYLQNMNLPLVRKNKSNLLGFQYQNGSLNH